MISKKHYLLLWFFIPLILFIGSISNIPSFDINYKDTFYTIDPFSLSIQISILLGLNGLGHLILSKISNREARWLKTIQIILTFIGILVFWIGLEGHFRTFAFKGNTINYIQILRIGVLTFIVSQLLFILIFVFSLKSKR